MESGRTENARGEEQGAGVVSQLPRKLIWILAFALLLRMALLIPAVTAPERAIAADTESYFRYARAILQGQGWEYPSALRTPGYPAFLALGSLLFGETPAALVAMQILMGVGVVLLTFVIGRNLFNEKTGLLAALLMAVSAESITHNFLLLSETLFTLLLILSMWLLWLSRTKPTNTLHVAAGLLMGLSILTRPIALYFPFLLVVIILLEKTTFRIRLRKTVLFLAGISVVVVPWIVRNTVSVGVATVSTISNNTLLFYNAVSLRAWHSGQLEGTVRTELRAEMLENLTASGLAATEANEVKADSEMARTIILADPVGYLWVHLKSDLNSLLPDTDFLEVWGFTQDKRGTLEVLKQQGLSAAVGHYFSGNLWMLWFMLPVMAVLGVTYLGWATGSIRTLLTRQVYPFLFLNMPIAYFLILPGAPSNPRFRVPVMPYFCLMAAFGLLFLWERFKARRAPAAA